MSSNHKNSTIADYSEKTEGLKIAHCLPWLERGTIRDASILQQYLIASELRKRGHHVTMMAPSSPNEVVFTENLDTFRQADRTFTRKIWFRLLSKLAWSLQQRLHIPYLNFFSNYRWADAYLQLLPEYDLVQERNGIYKAGAAIVCRRLKLPYVLFFDADELIEHDYRGDSLKGILRWRAKKLIAYNLETAQAIICVSQATRSRLVDHWGIQEEKVVVIPNGVDVYHNRPDPGRRSETRAMLGVGDDPLVIFVGGFYPWHDVSGLLQAFTSVLAVHPRSKLLLVGDGPDRSAMQQRAAELGIEQQTVFTGSIPHSEVVRFLNAGDIATAPYPVVDKDQFWFSPMKLFEYMASGLAIVASDLGQIAEVIADGSNGLLVPAGDLNALAAAITRLISEPSLRKRLSEQARRDAVEKHSWERRIDQLVAVYRTVLQYREHQK